MAIPLAQVLPLRCVTAKALSIFRLRPGGVRSASATTLGMVTEKVRTICAPS